MKYIALLLTLSILSCEKNQEDLTNIEKEYYQLENSVKILEAKQKVLRSSISVLSNTENYTRMISEGKKPLYILKLNVEQSSVSLDIGQHMKDSMNSSQFDIPVDKDYYDKLKVGDKISDKFKTGSIVMGGTWGSIEVSVKSKRIEFK